MLEQRQPFQQGLSQPSSQRPRRSGAFSRDQTRAQSREQSRESSEPPDSPDERRPQRPDTHDRTSRLAIRNPPQSDLTILSASDLLWQYDAVVTKLPDDQSAMSDLTL